MEYLSSGKILIVDLAAGETREEELEDDLISKRIGGIGITTHLLGNYKDQDPILMGCGLLTGTLYPASDLSIITAKSPVTKTVCHLPVALKAGIEFKYCGFDYLVILGKSANPSMLWIHDGVADLMDASAVWGKDVWQTTDAWRKEMGDDLIQTLVIGNCGERCSDLAQVSVNYWGSGDIWGFGSLFGEKRLKGIAMRGMGLLEVAEAEGFVDHSIKVLSALKQAPWGGKTGITDILTAMGRQDVSDWMAPMVHRNSSSYNVPYPYSTFLYLDEDPALLKEPEGVEPGIMITSPYVAIAAKDSGMSASEAFKTIRSCLRYGIDPEAAMQISAAEGKKTRGEMEAALDSMSRKDTVGSRPPFSHYCPGHPLFADFGTGKDSGDFEEWWMRRQALAYLFGVDPMFMLMSPEISAQSMMEAVRLGTGVDISEETLNFLVTELCA